MEVNKRGDAVWIQGVTDFCPQQVFECGQAFRWNRDTRGYIGIVGDKVIRADYQGQKQMLVLENCTLEDYHNVWKHYFDLDRDYDKVKRQLSSDKIMKEAVEYGRGIRVLNQDPWETLISFILSANNNVKRIQGIIEKLSIKYGKEIIWDGKRYHTFPAPESLAFAREEDLRDCGCGYRGPYIKKTARLVVDGLLFPYQLKYLPYEEAHRALLGCSGVGDKVADCVLLYSMEKAEAFPVDVWVKRVMEHFYIGHPASVKQIKSIAAKRFGKAAGLAQQYLFYYARDKQIGK
ncbi:MAG: DNA-3-methyladenine glycosylase family protein [Caldicoprobacterales bacterium]|nr:8-oxoguanine DNA glycosylase [Clostridiales bacterium]